jgi:hypothetical protein
MVWGGVKAFVTEWYLGRVGVGGWGFPKWIQHGGALVLAGLFYRSEWCCVHAAMFVDLMFYSFTLIFSLYYFFLYLFL